MAANRNTKDRMNISNHRRQPGNTIIIDEDGYYAGGQGHHANRLAFDLTSLGAIVVWAGVLGAVGFGLFLLALGVKLPPVFEILLTWVVPGAVILAIVFLFTRAFLRLINETRRSNKSLEISSGDGTTHLIRIPAKKANDFFYSPEEKVFLKPSATAPMNSKEMSESMAFQLAKVKAQQTTDIAGKLAEAHSEIAAATLGGLMAQQHGYRSAEEVPGVKEVLNHRQQATQSDNDDPNGNMRIYIMNEEEMPQAAALSTGDLFRQGQVTQQNLRELPTGKGRIDLNNFRPTFQEQEA